MAFDDAGDASALLGGAADPGGAAVDLGGGGDGVTKAGGDGGAGGGAPDWLQNFSAEGGEADAPSNRDWLAAKGFKTLDDVAKSLRSAEKAIHDKGRIAVPGDGAKPEEIAAFRAAIGVPDKAEGYDIKAPEGVKLNDPFIARLRESALRSGVPKAGFEGLVSDYIQAQLDDQTAESARQDGLANEWLKAQGGKRDEQLVAVTTAMRALGLSAAEGQAMRAAFGADRALGLLAKLGAGMSEDTLLGSGDKRFGVSGAEAQAELDRLKADPEWAKKAVKPGTSENARYNRLNQAAAEAKAREAPRL